MTGRPNPVFYLVAASGAAVILAALMAGAHAVGKWRQRRVWLKERAS